jgi:hypothetical protein
MLRYNAFAPVPVAVTKHDGGKYRAPIRWRHLRSRKVRSS